MGLQGKRIYSFWVVWPQDRHHQGPLDAPLSDGGYDSCEDETQKLDLSLSLDGSTRRIKTAQSLKKIVTHEAKAQKQAKEKVEEQINLHNHHDKHVSLGMKVAAAVAGGVVIGASTAGVGLIPYVVVVATAVAAGAAGAVGGAAWSSGHAQPFDSRVILGLETKEEAKEWKAAIEHQISMVERKKKPHLPSDINAETLMSILEANRLSAGWKKTGSIEGVRIMERIQPIPGTRSRRAQVVVKSSPVDTFLVVMETPSPFWPSQPNISGDIKVLKVIDDHADIIRLCITKSNSPGVFTAHKDGFQIEIILHRFWRYDDDGVYMITYSSTGQSQFSSNGGKQLPSAVDMNMVLTVSPRKDHKDFDDDLPESLVACTWQLSDKGWARPLLGDFMNLLLQQVIDLRDHFSLYSFVRFQPGQDLDPKFTDTFAYASGGGQWRKKYGIQVRPVFTAHPAKPVGIRRSLTEVPPELLPSPKVPEAHATTDILPSPKKRLLFGRKKAEEIQIETTRALETSPASINSEYEKHKKVYSHEIKGRIASLEYEVKREEKRLASKAIAKSTPRAGADAKLASSMNEELENFVEKKNQLVKLKETYKLVSGKDYDSASKGRLRGLRKFTSRALKRAGGAGAGNKASRPAEELYNPPPRDAPTFYRHYMSTDAFDEDYKVVAKEFKYTARRVPRRWEENCSSHASVWSSDEVMSRLFAIVCVVLVFIATILSEQLLVS